MVCHPGLCRDRAKLRGCGELCFEPPDLIAVVLLLFPQAPLPLLLIVSPLPLDLAQLHLKPLDLSVPDLMQS